MLRIDSAPALEGGPGTVVTGRFRHLARADSLLDVYVEGENEPIGCTAEHPFWSQTRRRFIPARDLAVGERLLTRTGRPAQVVSIHFRADAEPVYNLEVLGPHVYRVSSLGLLVHNASWDDATKKTNSWTEFLKNNRGEFRNLHEASLMYRFQGIKGAAYDDIVARIPAGATSRKLTPVAGKVQDGIEFKWVSGGVTNRVRLHGPDPSAGAGTNAASGWVARIQRGNRVLDDTGKWRHGNAHNPLSPFYDPAVANATHIPIQTPRIP